MTINKFSFEKGSRLKMQPRVKNVSGLSCRSYPLWVLGELLGGQFRDNSNRFIREVVTAALGDGFECWA